MGIKQRKRKLKKKMETSKILLLVSYTITIILTTLVVLGTFIGADVSNLTTITSLFVAEVSISNAYYYKKAAKENVPKVLASFPELYRENIDINQLLNQD